MSQGGSLSLPVGARPGGREGQARGVGGEQGPQCGTRGPPLTLTALLPPCPPPGSFPVFLSLHRCLHFRINCLAYTVQVFVVLGFFSINLFILLFYFIYLLFLAALGLCCCVWAFSSCGEQGLLFLLRWLLLLQSAGSRHAGFSSCGTWASVVVARRLSSCGSRALERRLSSCGLVALRPVGSSWTRDRTHVPCIDRWILNHCECAVL